ncbi:21 kDa protein [Dendrobium catenatum]|uniref:21 kDa protein n=1 Tax=Dendrobium catenatum TaxID=906689 RepID=UPI0009F5312F|nr:21 kDa protein [Dendrobium catenatum]
MAPSTQPFFATTTLTIFLIMLSLRLNPSHAARPLPANSKTATSASTNAAELFVKSACSSTTYPDLCVSSLSSYSSSINKSPMLLAHTALSVSLDGARSASTAMRSMSTGGGRLSPREAGAMRDCVENVGDSIDELRDSLSEMGTLRMGKDLAYKINSIQTWVSAALTDDDSCMEGFRGKRMDGTVKTAVRGPIVNVAHLTSNALALINALASSTTHSGAVAP